MTARALLLALFWVVLSFCGAGACTAAGFSRASDKIATGAAVYGVCLAPCAVGCMAAPDPGVAGGSAVHGYFACLAPCAVTCAAAALEAHFQAQAREKPAAQPGPADAEPESPKVPPKLPAAPPDGG